MHLVLYNKIMSNKQEVIMKPLCQVPGCDKFAQNTNTTANPIATKGTIK